jgi:glutamate synthase domain-containing protein 2
MNVKKFFIVFSIVTIVSISILSIYIPSILWAFALLGPIIIVGYIDLLQKKQTIRRNFPVIGNLRYFFESIRPEIMQYFVETDIEGRPINRQYRSLVYQRAKNINDTTPFGTQLNVYDIGYEWVDHSIYSAKSSEIDHNPRVLIGGKNCSKPYSASILNISAMSFGSLSKNAIMAMNKGAKLNNFAHNTGEGGISPYHKEPGGDLIWQIGTGYFGCRFDDGTFNPEGFIKNANLDNVKMIEIKISQGAKPGHGGILPASKNTEEIAAIRHVKPHTEVLSPPSHSAFNTPEGLLNFIKQLRELSNGKPIGFKLCVGKKSEFIDICKAMLVTGITPDFISVDGGEGGTGAAPVEFSNSIGMPLRDGLSFVVDTLNGYDLKKDIKVIASGKVFSGFHMARLIAMGADIIYSARAMMLATGCIQALQCHSNKCPTGVATQNKSLMKGLVVEDKAQKVANYHKETVNSFVELMAATGVSKPAELKREHINRRTSMNHFLNYNDIYPRVEVGSYLNEMAQMN